VIPQAEDFKAESLALHELLTGIDANRYDEKTQFKDWTINCVLQHLHFWNMMANLSLTDEAEFLQILGEVLESDLGMPGFEKAYLNDLKGVALLDAWHDFFLVLAQNFSDTDPKKRLKWAGPDMSARSSITARLMETWAHGQEVYDHLSVERVNTDRIKNIAHLGTGTFGFTYALRGRTVPDDVPYVKLTAPSGASWEWNEPNTSNFVEGDAVEFCQVVTQSRNVAETGLKVVGHVAGEWMSMAQCFAGGAETPPPVGTRFTQKAS
jgi:uncharacterized protein (TIGR03084 family)